MGIIREERFGNARLILGDCRAVVPELPPVDAIVSDPPYGQKLKTNIEEGIFFRTVKSNGLKINSTRWPKTLFGDDESFSPAPWLSMAPRVLLWGAHKFYDRLPKGSLLIWDKVPTGKVRDQGDGEVAWINDDPPKALRIFRLLWDGVCVDAAARAEIGGRARRVHPTQKPIALMSWCLAQMRLPPGALILDPYMGSGSTLVAALKAGHPSIGIEIEPLYFETACRRVAEEARQMTLALSAPAAAHAQ